MIMKSGDLTLGLDQARRLAVRSQHLAGPRPAAGLDGMRQVLRRLPDGVRRILSMGESAGRSRRAQAR
jgi:hypothetical protein